jgi:predicted phage replisome organizer
MLRGGKTMSDVKKYYYLKLKEDFFNSEKVKVLETMPNGIHYTNLLLKLYLISIKNDGALKLTDDIYYDEKMLVSLTNLNKKIVDSGVKVLTSMGFIERLKDGSMFMSDIQSFIGKSNSEAERKKLYRDKIEEVKLLQKQCDDTKVAQMSQECPVETRTIDEITLDKFPPENRDNSLKLIANSLEPIANSLNNKSIINKEIERKYIISSLSVGLLKDFEDKTGAIGSLNLAAVNKAVELHGAENVKMAMDKALEKNRPTMTYINGILKNWAVEGYPKEDEKVGNGSFSKNNGAGSNEFTGFKPKEPRSLSEEERAALEKELI